MIFLFLFCSYIIFSQPMPLFPRLPHIHMHINRISSSTSWLFLSASYLLIESRAMVHQPETKPESQGFSFHVGMWACELEIAFASTSSQHQVIVFISWCHSDGIPHEQELKSRALRPNTFLPSVVGCWVIRRDSPMHWYLSSSLFHPFHLFYLFHRHHHRHHPFLHLPLPFYPVREGRHKLYCLYLSVSSFRSWDIARSLIWAYHLRLNLQNGLVDLTNPDASQVTNNLLQLEYRARGMMRMTKLRPGVFFEPDSSEKIHEFVGPTTKGRKSYGIPRTICRREEL